MKKYLLFVVMLLIPVLNAYGNNASVSIKNDGAPAVYLLQGWAVNNPTAVFSFQSPCVYTSLSTSTNFFILKDTGPNYLTLNVYNLNPITNPNCQPLDTPFQVLKFNVSPGNSYKITCINYKCTLNTFSEKKLIPSLKK